MGANKPGASRTLSLIKLGGVIHRGMDAEDNARCVYCGIVIKFDEHDAEHSGTIDHVYSEGSPILRKAKIGYNDVENLVTACRTCNAVKSAGTDEDWEYFATYLESRGIDYKEMLRELQSQMTRPIQDEWARYWAEQLFPERREYNLTASRMRALRKRHGSNAEERARELDRKRDARRKDDDEAPF